jgi:hypothetical protein
MIAKKNSDSPKYRTPNKLMEHISTMMIAVYAMPRVCYTGDEHKCNSMSNLLKLTLLSQNVKIICAAVTSTGTVMH